MRLFLILVFSLSNLLSIAQKDSIYINTYTSDELKSEVSKYNKGEFYDLAFTKPKTEEQAIYQYLKTIPQFIIFNPKGQKLCKRNLKNFLPSKFDVEYIDKNYKKCYEQYRETKSGEKIPELIPYTLEELLAKTQPLKNKKDLESNLYTIVFPWKTKSLSIDLSKFKNNNKAYFKALHKATKNEKLNLIRLNRDAQKSWGFGDSIKVKITNVLK